ncbi:MAG: energy transducer TonB [Marivirga sp.]|nr:energy transducer TonB [Marivirga sp.]
MSVDGRIQDKQKNLTFMIRIFIITVGLISLFSSASKSQDNVSSDSVYTTVDVQPEFPGGRKALGKYVDGKNHTYPEEAQKNKIEGKVVIQFIINEDGTPSDFEVIEGIGYGCDEAALEAFKKMPKWKPGLVDGVPVKVRTRMGYMYKL